MVTGHMVTSKQTRDDQIIHLLQNNIDTYVVKMTVEVRGKKLAFAQSLLNTHWKIKLLIHSIVSNSVCMSAKKQMWRDDKSAPLNRDAVSSVASRSGNGTNALFTCN